MGRGLRGEPLCRYTTGSPREGGVGSWGCGVVGVCPPRLLSIKGQCCKGCGPMGDPTRGFGDGGGSVRGVGWGGVKRTFEHRLQRSVQGVAFIPTRPPIT
jgi:hypothetical protein